MQGYHVYFSGLTKGIISLPLFLKNRQRVNEEVRERESLTLGPRLA